MIIDENVYLSHHGVKGQKWGVRNEDKPTGRKKGSTQTKSTSTPAKQTLTADDKAILAKLDPTGEQGIRLRAMYGPQKSSTPLKVKPIDPKTDPHHLTPAQKHALVVGAKFAVGAVAVYGLYKVGQNANESFLGIRDANPEFKQFFGTMNKTKLKTAKGLSEKAVRNFSTEPVNLRAGSIIRRISTEAETTIKSDGFFAAYKPEDVQRYKAVLPAYWKMWGMGASEGYVVKLKAVEGVRAPSKKETFELFKELIGDKTPDGRYARQHLPRHALNWNDSHNPDTKAFFQLLKSKGYNAVIDMNDAGSIGDTPIRVFSGKSFEIAGHDRLNANSIKKARENILALKHFVQQLFERNYDGWIRPYSSV